MRLLQFMNHFSYHNRRRSASNGLVPIVSRLASTEGETNPTQATPATSGAPSSVVDAAGSSSSASVESGSGHERRRAASHDAAGARRKTVAPQTEDRMKKKAHSLTAVNGRDANSGGVTRRTVSNEGGHGSASTASNRSNLNLRRRPKEGKANRPSEDNDDASGSLNGSYSISLRDMVGGLQNMRQMGGSFSRGLLSSSSPPAANVNGEATSSNTKDRTTIYHGRRVGQAKRLAQPGRLVAMNGEGARRYVEMITGRIIMDRCSQVRGYL